MHGWTKTVAWVSAALWATGCGPQLDGTWYNQGVDTSITMTLEGPANGLRGTAHGAGEGTWTATVSGTQTQLEFTSPGGSSSFAVFALDSNSIFLEVVWTVPVTGTCDALTFQYDECTGHCPAADTDAQGTPGGLCFIRE